MNHEHYSGTCPTCGHPCPCGGRSLILSVPVVWPEGEPVLISESHDDDTVQLLMVKALLSAAQRVIDCGTFSDSVCLGCEGITRTHSHGD